MADRDIPEETGRYTLEDLAMSPAERERCELRGRIMAAVADVVPDLGDREYEACADRVLSAALAGRQVSCDRCANQVGYVVCDDCQKTLDREAGRQVVHLPEPDDTANDIRDNTAWDLDTGEIVRAFVEDGAAYVSFMFTDTSPDDAEQFGLTLIAAAREARRLAAGSGSGED